MRLVNDEVTVRAPAIATGVGSPFGTVGLCLGLADTFTVRATTLAKVSDDAFTRGLFAGLESVGAPLFRPDITVGTRIPSERGLGEDISHVIAGLVAAQGMLGNPEDFDILGLADDLGVDPLAAATSLQGGALVGTLRLEPPTYIRPTLFIPDFSALSSQWTPEANEHVKADKVCRAMHTSALLGAVLAGAGDVHDLFEATEDVWALTNYATIVPASVALVEWLRESGFPATLAGKGTAVISLTPVSVAVTEAAKSAGWRVLSTSLDLRGTEIL